MAEDKREAFIRDNVLNGKFESEESSKPDERLLAVLKKVSFFYDKFSQRMDTHESQVEDRSVLDSNKSFSFVRYHYDACYALCQQDSHTPFFNVKETLCLRNCFTKTNACYNAVMDNLENTGAVFYRDENEKLATKSIPNMAA